MHDVNEPRASGLERLRMRARSWLDRPRPDRDVRSEVLVRLVRLLLTAVVVGLVALLVVYKDRSSVLSGRTDIMGYNPSTGFGPVPYERTYIGSVGLVVLGLATWWVLGWIPRLRSGARSLRVELGPALTSPDVDQLTPRVAAGRGGAVALALAVEGSLVAGLTDAAFIAVVAGVALVGAVASGAAIRSGRVDGGRIGGGIVIGGLLSVAGLGLVSAGSHVSTRQGDRSVDWFPWWVALPLAALAAFIVWRRARTDEGLDLGRATQDVLVGVVGPVLVLLFVARLTGMLGLFDMFHEGESLVPATALRSGLVPWRDFLFIHGLLQDVFWAIPGLVLLEDSRWGAFAGQWLWLLPAYWLAQYVLAAWLFRTRRWMIAVFVAITLVGPVLLGGSLVAIQFRMLLQPLLLVALGAVLQRPSWRRAAVLGGLAAIDFAIAPETVLVIAPIALVMLAYEADRWWREGRVELAAAWRTAVSGVVGLGLFAVYLVATDSLSGVVHWFETFALDHNLTGAIPVQWDLGYRFIFEVFLTVIIPLAMIVLAAIRRRVVGSLRRNDWVMLAAALGALAYYPKFIARPDFHIEHVWPLVVPIALYLAAELVDVVDRGIHQLAPRVAWDRRAVLARPAAIVLLLAVLLPSTTDVFQRLGEGAERFRPEVGKTVDIPRVGYFNGEGGLEPEKVAKIDTALRAAGARTHGFFDFTNTPGLFHYILRLPTATPFYNISMAIPPSAQRELIRDLERSDPQVVAWSAPPANYGLPSWDGVSNQARHYLVSQWILDRYVPYVKVGGYGIWVRRDARAGLPAPSSLDPDPDSGLVDAQTPSCAWGNAPRYLDQRPSSAARRSSTPVTFEPANGVLVRGWATVETGPASRILAVIDGQVLAEGEPIVFRPDIVKLHSDDRDPNRFEYSGFELFIDRTGQAVDVNRLQVIALDGRGHGTVLAGSPGAALPPPELDGITLSDTAVSGSLDGYPNVEAPPGRTLWRTPVSDDLVARTNWIELDGGSPAPAELEVSGQPDDPRRIISATVGGKTSSPQFIRVGACSQWPVIDGWLYVIVRGDYPLDQVRLVG